MARNDSDDDLLGLGITIKTNVQIQAELVAEKDRYFKPLIQRIDSEIEYLERQRDCAESSYNYANKSAEGLLQKAITRINNIHVRAYKAAANIETGLSTQEDSSLEQLLAEKPKSTLSIEDDAEVSIGYIPEELAKLLLPESAKEEDVIARAELIASQYANNFGGEANARRVISDPLTNQFRLCALKRMAGEEYGSYISEIDKLLEKLIQKRGEVTDKDANTAERIQKNESAEQLKTDIRSYSNETTTFLRSIARERNELLARMQDVAQAPAYQIDERKIDKLAPSLRGLVRKKVEEFPQKLSYTQKASMIDSIRIPSKGGSTDHPNSAKIQVHHENTRGYGFRTHDKYKITAFVLGDEYLIVDEVYLLWTKTDHIMTRELDYDSRKSLTDLGIHYETDSRSTWNFQLITCQPLSLKDWVEKPPDNYDIKHTIKTYTLPSSPPDILSPIKMSDIFPELHLNEKDKKRGRGGVKIPEEFRHFISLPAEIEEALGTNHQTEVRVRNAKKSPELREGDDVEPQRAGLFSKVRNLLRRGGKEE